MARNISIQERFGVVGVTSVGVFSSAPVWAVPITNATVTVAVGSIAPRPRVFEGRLEEREHLLLTLSFNHDLVDGAPAARFTNRFVERLQEAGELVALVAGEPEPTSG
jgi:pyruvate/2-oxoglutarate dehydrogenase complex dihydrolipoamide acyltransferase (E2) component